MIIVAEKGIFVRNEFVTLGRTAAPIRKDARGVVVCALGRCAILQSFALRFERIAVVSQRVACPEVEFLEAVFGPHVANRALPGAGIIKQGTALLSLRVEIKTALDSLSYRERGVLEMRYGLGDGHAYTLAEAGFVFGLTRERIRQLQVCAIERLQRRAEGLRDCVESLGAKRPALRPRFVIR